MSLTPEQFHTLHEAAGLLNVPYFKIQRAAKRGQIPVYRLFNNRPLVRVSEIEQVMKKKKKKTGEEGGQE
jgi:excisionase family DNA binding protein